MRSIIFIFLGTMFLVFAACKNILNDESQKNTLLADNTKGMCIYPLLKVTSTVPGDTASSTREILGKEPYISYNEIVSYDTIYHILKLTISVNELQKRIDQKNLEFAVTLNGEILYQGSFRYNFMSSTYSKASIIPGDELDTLKSNEIRISNGYPKWYYSDYNDDRYQPSLFNCLRKDNKAIGKLFCTSSGRSIVSGNEGVEFFYVKGFKGIPDTPMVKIINQVDLSMVILDDNPFLTYNKIAFYDTINTKFGLCEPLNLLEQPRSVLFNKAFVITVNRKPVLLGGFFSAVMSASCSYINIIPDEPSHNPLTKYILRLNPPRNYDPKFKLSPNPVNIQEMVDRLKIDGKMRNNFVL